MIFVNLEEEVEIPCGDEVYYTNHQIHAKHIKIRELRSVIHSLEHDIEDGFEKEFRVGLNKIFLVKMSRVREIHMIFIIVLKQTYQKDKINQSDSFITPNFNKSF